MKMNHQPTAKFSILPKTSVALYAESLGHTNLGDEVLINLAEDVTYRLRETINNAVRFTRHSKRRCLTTDDVNRALIWSDSEPIHGQNGVDVPNFRSFNFKDSTMSYIEDRDSSLRETAFDQTLPADPGEVSIKAQWLVFEGRSCSGGKQSKDDIGSKEVLEEPFALILEQLISSVFGSNTNARKIALDTIRNNGKLQSILPYLVTFLASQVKSCNGNDSLKTIVKGVLFIVHALTDNTSLFLIPYVIQIVKLLLFIIIDGNLPVSFWHCKMNAARILTQLCRRHMTTMNNLPHHLLKAYQETLSDESKPLGSLYGAAFGMSCLGSELTHQLVYPTLMKRIPSIIEIVDVSKDLNTINGSLAVIELFQSISMFLLRAASCIPSNTIATKPIRLSGGASSATATTTVHKYFSVYKDVSGIFGDVIALHIQFQRNVDSNMRSVFSPFKGASSKTGIMVNQDESFVAPNGLMLKREPPTEVAMEIGGRFSLGAPSLTSKQLESKEVRNSIQTSCGELTCYFNVRLKRKIGDTIDIFNGDESNCEKTTIKSKRRKIEKEESRISREDSNVDKDKIYKQSQKFFKIKRLRLIDLARIPSTTYLLI